MKVRLCQTELRTVGRVKGRSFICFQGKPAGGSAVTNMLSCDADGRNRAELKGFDLVVARKSLCKLIDFLSKVLRETEDGAEASG